MKQTEANLLLLDAIGRSDSARVSEICGQYRQKDIEVALAKLDRWIEAEAFLGWDPHDALNSPLLHWAGATHRLIGIALVQLLRRSPFNFRPALGITKGYNPKAMGLFLATYAQKFEISRNGEHFERATFFSDWLVRHASQGYHGVCWGYNFDWPNRGFFAPAKTPTVVNTAFIGLSFLSADPAFTTWRGEKAGTGHQRVTDGLAVARSACEFILHDLHVIEPANGETCFSYTPIDRRFVHNANVLGAWLLAAVYSRTRERELAEASQAAARFTVRRQKVDGSWAYGTGARDCWVDNFHTGYVLVGLKKIAKCLGTHEFDEAIRAGYNFWKTHMFLARVIPKYYPDQAYPIDIHSVAQAILTLLEFSDVDAEAHRLATEVALWAIRVMQDHSGFFHYQIRRGFRIRIPYMRWSEAWMQYALSRLLMYRNPHATF